MTNRQSVITSDLSDNVLRDGLSRESGYLATEVLTAEYEVRKRQLLEEPADPRDKIYGQELVRHATLLFEIACELRRRHRAVDSSAYDQEFTLVAELLASAQDKMK